MEFISCVPFAPKIVQASGSKPARAYLNTQAEVREHFNLNRDFIITDLFHGSGRHVNKQDVLASPAPLKLTVRYGKDQEKQCVLP